MNIRQIISKGGLALGVLMLLASFSHAQTTIDPLASWDKDVLKQANTAGDASYLDDEEKKFVFYTKLCRLKPKLFCETVLADYLKTHTDKSAQIASLKRQLNQDKSCGALVLDKDMCTMARKYAVKMGKEGKEGHINFQGRMKPFLGHYHAVGENCDYGNELGLDACMALLIDLSEPTTLGHRKNILDANFKVVGVARAPHKTFRWNYVMDFGG